MAQHNPAMAQIALSVRDRAVSREWYEALGLQPSGSFGPIKVQDSLSFLDKLPKDAEINISYLLGREPLTQLELIQFSSVENPRDQGPWTAAREGYGFVTVVVQDFEAQLRRLQARGGLIHMVEKEELRSFWIQDPDGVWVEVTEQNPRGLTAAAEGCDGLASILSVSLTVRDLDTAVDFWTRVLGFETAQESVRMNDIPLELCNGASFRQRVLRSGAMFVRFLQPRSNAIVPRAADYQLSDIGVLNVAVLIQDREIFDAYVTHLLQNGFQGSMPGPQAVMEGVATFYGVDTQGFSVEIAFLREDLVEQFGWWKK